MCVPKFCLLICLSICQIFRFYGQLVLAFQMTMLRLYPVLLIIFIMNCTAEEDQCTAGTVRSNIIIMLLILDGNNIAYVPHDMKENKSLWRKNIRFTTALDLIKYFKQIKLQRLLLTCAPFSDLPSDISTMIIKVNKE